jgi:RNA polymerase sigma-70 factor (ECF subfamily)
MASDAQRDREWIERIQRGDESAFTELFKTYYPQLCEFAYASIRSYDVTEEAVDDVLFTIWEHRAVSVPADHVAAYLFAAVRNRALKGIRGRDRRWRREERYAEEQYIGSTSERDGIANREMFLGREGDDSDLVAQVREATLELPERCREIFTLRWVSHLSYAEIASVMGVSVKTVENQLAIALKKVRERLRRE